MIIQCMCMCRYRYMYEIRCCMYAGECPHPLRLDTYVYNARAYADTDTRVYTQMRAEQCIEARRSRD